MMRAETHRRFDRRQNSANTYGCSSSPLWVQRLSLRLRSERLRNCCRNLLKLPLALCQGLRCQNLCSRQSNLWRFQLCGGIRNYFRRFPLCRSPRFLIVALSMVLAPLVILSLILSPASGIAHIAGKWKRGLREEPTGGAPKSPSGSPGLQAANNIFSLNGQEFRVFSGSVHYFRIPEGYWRDRLMKLQAAGLNTVDTYVPWALHEHREGEFNFASYLDVVKFIQLAHELKLLVIIRPGPYICSEFDLGGLPAWLLSDPSMKLRSMHPKFKAAVEQYFDKLMPLLAPLQYSNGGPIIAFQVENEYGAYGSDKEYLGWLKESMESRGLKELFFTSDNSNDIERGSLSSGMVALTFDQNAKSHFEKLSTFRPDIPKFAGEFWPGWFDHWRENHHRISVEDFEKRLREILDLGASVNQYMFAGGTNWGFMNGYDYDAPISEIGQLTAKWNITRTLMQTFNKNFAPEKYPTSKLATSETNAYGNHKISHCLPLTAILEQMKPTKVSRPDFMETFCQHKLTANQTCKPQAYGFIAYRTTVKGAENLAVKAHIFDRAIMLIDGHIRRTISPKISLDDPMDLSKPYEFTETLANTPNSHDIIFLVENMGRVNYDTLPHTLDNQRKGMSGTVKAGNQEISEWDTYNLEFDDQFWKSTILKGWLPFNGTGQGQPGLYMAHFNVAGKAKDTFLDMQKWTKGNAFINHSNLGRYWKIGPQQTLFVPSTALIPGQNEALIFEWHDPSDKISLVSSHYLG